MLKGFPFKANKVPVHLEPRLSQVMDDGVKVTGKDGRSFEIDADARKVGNRRTVICCCGLVKNANNPSVLHKPICKY